MKKIVGIKIRTNNSRVTEDIMPLWNRYFSEGHDERLHSKDSKTYAVYFNYDSNESWDFDLLVWVEWGQFDDYDTVDLNDGSYKVFEPEEKKMPEAVFSTWKKIWDSSLDRAFLTDYEVYDNSKDPKDPELKIFIWIN